MTDVVTDAMIETAILAALTALTDTESGLIRWRTLRKSVPGHPWRQAEALTRLWQTWRINLMNIGGNPYVWPADEDDHHDKTLRTAAGLHRDSDAIIVL